MVIKKIFLFIFISNIVNAQSVRKLFFIDSINIYTKSDTTFPNKKIPLEFKDAIRIALQNYPELNQIHMMFKIKKTISPLSARPTFFSIFRKPSKRKYLIKISNLSKPQINSILLQNLSFNSQIGVLGHEIAHIQHYNSKRGIYFIGLVLKHLNRAAMDRFEYNTDKITIEHGLGFQLLSWSNEVRLKLKMKQWGGSNQPNGKRERYMNPETIKKYIRSLSVYENYLLE